MNVLTSGFPGDAASDRNVEAGVAQQVLVVGLESVEVVIVLPLASLPAKGDLMSTHMYQYIINLCLHLPTLTSSTSEGMTGRCVSMFLSRR